MNQDQALHAILVTVITTHPDYDKAGASAAAINAAKAFRAGLDAFAPKTGGQIGGAGIAAQPQDRFDLSLRDRITIDNLLSLVRAGVLGTGSGNTSTFHGQHMQFNASALNQSNQFNANQYNANAAQNKPGV